MMGGMDWITLAQDKDQLWAFVKMVITFRVPNILGNSWAVEKVEAS
jgi:hypothetical protein